jgi:hypothetical protein
MFIKHGILAVVLSVTCAAAQDTKAQNAYRGQSWVGLLVASECTTGNTGSADRNRTTVESDLTTHGRTTTPAVDQSGTRGQSTELAGEANRPAENQRLPQTGDILAHRGTSIDPDWAPAQRQAKALSESCAVHSKSTRFALLLPDGSKLEFDELANQAIAKQMPAMPSGDSGRKILRVSVQGKLQNGKIALTSIQM